MVDKCEEKIDFIQVECQRKLWQVLRNLQPAVQQNAAQKIPRHRCLDGRKRKRRHVSFLLLYQFSF